MDLGNDHQWLTDIMCLLMEIYNIDYNAVVPKKKKKSNLKLIKLLNLAIDS